MKNTNSKIIYGSFLIAIIIFSAFIAFLIGPNISDLFDNDQRIEELDKEIIPLSIVFDQGKEYETSLTRYAFSFVSNKNNLETSSNRVKLFVTKDLESRYIYVAEVKNLERGSNQIKFTVKDTDGFEYEFDTEIFRNRVYLPRGLNDIDNWPDTEYIVDGENLLTDIDKQHRLTDDFVPPNLVDLNKEYFLYTNYEGLLLREDAAENLKVMLEDLKADTGKNLVIASGYRSISEQFDVYTGWLASLGQVEADKISARPGYSQHHLGTVVDFISDETNFEFKNSFDETIGGKWLLDNAHKYGYVQTYPKNSTEQTGYSYEAWQYRYVGREHAESIHDSGKTLHEYIKERVGI